MVLGGIGRGERDGRWPWWYVHFADIGCPKLRARRIGRWDLVQIVYFDGQIHLAGGPIACGNSAFPARNQAVIGLPVEGARVDYSNKARFHIRAGGIGSQMESGVAGTVRCRPEGPASTWG